MSNINIHNINKFKNNINIFTQYQLININFNNILLTGYSNLFCLLYENDKEKLKDIMNYQYPIDLFFYDINNNLAKEKIIDIYNKLCDFLPLQVHCYLYDDFIIVSAGFPYKDIKIHLNIFDSINDILNSIKTDCFSIGYNGNKLFSSERFLNSINNYQNNVNNNINSNDEVELYKAKHLGFKIKIIEDDIFFNKNLYFKNPNNLLPIERLYVDFYSNKNLKKIINISNKFAIFNNYNYYSYNPFDEQDKIKKKIDIKSIEFKNHLEDTELFHSDFDFNNKNIFELIINKENKDIINKKNISVNYFLFSLYHGIFIDEYYEIQKYDEDILIFCIMINDINTFNIIINKIDDNNLNIFNLLKYCCIFHNHNILKILYSKYNLSDYFFNNDNYILYYAIYYCNFLFLNFLIKIKHPINIFVDGKSPLVFALERYYKTKDIKYLAIINYLLKIDNNVYYKNNNVIQPMEILINNSDYDMMNKFVFINKDIINMVVKNYNSNTFFIPLSKIRKIINDNRNNFQDCNTFKNNKQIENLFMKFKAITIEEIDFINGDYKLNNYKYEYEYDNKNNTIDNNITNNYSSEFINLYKIICNNDINLFNNFLLENNFSSIQELLNTVIIKYNCTLFEYCFKNYILIKILIGYIKDNNINIIYHDLFSILLKFLSYKSFKIALEYYGLDWRDKKGNNILHYFIKYKINLSDINNYNYFIYKKCLLELLNLKEDLVNENNDNNITPLFECINLENYNAISIILKYNEKYIYIYNNNGLGLIHYICKKKLNDNIKKIIDILIGYEKDIINFQTKNKKYIALMICIIESNKLMFNYLIDKNADINKEDIYMNNIYHYLIFYNKDYFEDKYINKENMFGYCVDDYLFRNYLFNLKLKNNEKYLITGKIKNFMSKINKNERERIRVNDINTNSFIERILS